MARDITKNHDPFYRKQLLKRYGERFGQMTVEEYAFTDATYAADQIIPGSYGPEETSWTTCLLNTHADLETDDGKYYYDFHFSVENQQLYKRVFREEYGRRYEAYFEGGD